jgi:hypothetical protein
MTHHTTQEPPIVIDKRLSFDNLLNMTKIVNLKAFREDVEKYVKLMEKDEDEELIVMKRSKALFKITPPVESTWETIIDFTEYQPGGMPADEVLKLFDENIASRKLKKHGQPNSEKHR